LLAHLCGEVSNLRRSVLMSSVCLTAECCRQPRDLRLRVRVRLSSLTIKSCSQPCHLRLRVSVTLISLIANSSIQLVSDITVRLSILSNLTNRVQIFRCAVHQGSELLCHFIAQTLGVSHLLRTFRVTLSLSSATRSCSSTLPSTSLRSRRVRLASGSSLSMLIRVSFRGLSRRL